MGPWRSALLIPLFLACAARDAHAQDYSFTTLAGRGSCGRIDGQGAAARLCSPRGIAMEPGGTFVFVDNSQYLRRATADGRVTTLGDIYAAIGLVIGSLPVPVMALDGTAVYLSFGDNLTKLIVRSDGTIVQDTSTPLPGDFRDQFGHSQVRALAVDASGNLFVARPCDIQREMSTGPVAFAGVADQCGSTDGTSGARFSGISAMAFGADGTLYVAESGLGSADPEGRVRKISPSGAVTTLAPIPEPWLDNPELYLTFRKSPALTGIAVDAAGSAYVTAGGFRQLDSGDAVYDARVLKISAAGTVTTMAGYAGDRAAVDGVGAAARFGQPAGVAINRTTGELFVTDSANHTIARIKTDATVTSIAGLAPVVSPGNATNAGIAGLAIDSSGSLFVSDSRGLLTDMHRILKIDRGGSVSTLAGLALQGGSADGTGSDARFWFPGSLAFDTGGDLFAYDTGNCTIRRISPGSVVTTDAGTAGVCSGAGSLQATGPIAVRSGTVYGFRTAVAPQTGISVVTAGGTTVGTLASPVGAGGIVATPSSIYVSAGYAIYSVGGGVFTRVAGGDVSGNVDGIGPSARFNLPAGLAADAAGHIYVADGCTVRKVAPGGVVTTLANVPELCANGQAAVFVAVDAGGRVFVASTRTIMVVEPDGSLRMLFAYGSSALFAVDGTGSGAKFGYPNGVAAGSGGNVYVADTHTNTVRRVTATGVVTTLAGVGIGSADGTRNARFGLPRAITVDTGGTVYVADNHSVIRKISPAGVVTTLAGNASDARHADGDATTARFTDIVGIAASAGGDTLYVADYYAIRAIALASPISVRTIAGADGQPGSADGSGTAARFNWHAQGGGIAVDSAGAVYVADTNNATIRKIVNGVVSTIAGTAGSTGTGDGTGAAARFTSPTAIAADAAGNLYVTDANGIRKITTAGVVTTVGGAVSNVLAGYVDATGSRARFQNPLGIAVDTSGALLVADTENHVIRKGVVTSRAAERTALTFGGVTRGGAMLVTAGQTVSVSFASSGVSWTASSNQPFVVVSPGSGTGRGSFTVSIDNTAAGAMQPGTYQATVTIQTSGALVSTETIVVRFVVVAASAAPLGAFDTPAEQSTGLQGSIAVTGWALDDIDVDRVELWRDVAPGETTPPVFMQNPADPRNGRIFISNATFVDGARPDVETQFGSMPRSYRAGWGYLMLTWGLWNQGNGPFTLYAFALDKEGNISTLGTKVINVNNNAANRPLGSVDTPGIGATVSGTVTNFGWGLTPKVNGAATCRIQSNGVQVSIDSGPLQPVVYGDVRSDIAGAFAGFSNSNAAGGHYILDTTQYANGPHTIGWLITDDCSRADGVGSRFFTVQNGSQVAGSQASLAPSGQVQAVENGVDSADVVTVAHGYGNLPTIVGPDATGLRLIHVVQGDRIELRLPRGYGEAYQRVNGIQRALPAGATWDGANGIFYWQPAVAFLGTYRFIFSDGPSAVEVRVVVRP